MSVNHRFAQEFTRVSGDEYVMRDVIVVDQFDLQERMAMLRIIGLVAAEGARDILHWHEIPGTFVRVSDHIAIGRGCLEQLTGRLPSTCVNHVVAWAACK